MHRQWRQLGCAVCAMIAAVAFALPVRAQSLQKRLQAHVSFLASPELDGRGNGSKGLESARDYIVEQMKEIGLEPAGTSGYLSAIEAVTHAEPSRHITLSVGEHVLAPGVEFAPASFSDGGDFQGQPVFVGYGLSAPSVGYDDYAAVDVRGKVVIALTGAPAGHKQALSSDRRAYLLSTGSKAAVALAHGARALLLVNDPRGHGDRPQQAPDDLAKLRPAFALSGISVARLTEKAAVRALADAGVDLAELQQRIDDSGEPQSRALEVRVAGNLSVDRKTHTIENVLGMLPGTDDASKKPVVVTAHYDGLGDGTAGSLSPDLPALHPGADDNASGVAVLIELARAFSEKAPSKHPPIIFAAPAGEELGLRGSRRLARRLVERYGGGTIVNFDMLGRLRDGELKVAHGPGDAAIVPALDAASTEAGLTVRGEPLDARFSDHVSFVELGFRGVHITTGRHGDYHVPGDTLDKLNIGGMARVYSFVEAMLQRLM